MNLDLIIFGAIGSLTETSHLQRDAFNTAFADAGLDWHWSAAEYASLVADGGSGGEARIAAYAVQRGAPLEPRRIMALHAAKSANFQGMMRSQGLRPNPGVVDLLAQARAAGIAVAMASTTSAGNIAAMFAATAPTLTAAMFDFVADAGTVVRGKPAPDVYDAVLARLGISASAAVAIEDTMQSAASPAAARIATFVVPGIIARNQDFGRLPTARSIAALGGLPALRAWLADASANAAA